MDKRGSGILRMIEAMKGLGLPNPVYKEDSGYFVIKFTGPYQRTTIKISGELNKRQKRGIEYLRANAKITTAEYMGLTTTSFRTAKRDLLNLKNKKIIKFVGSLKTGYYVLMAL